MSAKLQKLSQTLVDVFGGRITAPVIALDEVTIEVSAADYADVMRSLRDNEALQFEQLIDLCGVDYSTYTGYEGLRYATVVHLLSLKHNWRVRVRCFSADDAFPILSSVTSIWTAAEWFDRGCHSNQAADSVDGFQVGTCFTAFHFLLGEFGTR